MKTAEKIEQAEKLLAELKAELLKEDKPDYKIGDWVKVIRDGCNASDLNDKTHACNGIYANPNWEGNLYSINSAPKEWRGSIDWKEDAYLLKDFDKDVGHVYEHGMRHATTEEIKAHLIEEAEKRGYKEGVKYRTVMHGEKRTISEKLYDYHIGFLSYKDVLFMDHNTIYMDGKWAEIIKDDKSTFITIPNNYRAEISPIGDVIIGHYTLPFSKIKELYKAAKKKANN